MVPFTCARCDLCGAVAALRIAIDGETRLLSGAAHMPEGWAWIDFADAAQAMTLCPLHSIRFADEAPR